MVGGQLCDMACIVPMHVKPKFTYLLTCFWLQIHEQEIMAVTICDFHEKYDTCIGLILLHATLGPLQFPDILQPSPVTWQ